MTSRACVWVDAFAILLWVRAGLAAGWFAFVIAVFGVTPAHAWLDAGELGAAGVQFGVMHPPGMPGLAPLLVLARLLPVGGIGFRMALVSALMAAVAAFALVIVLERRRTHPLVIGGAVVWMLAGLTFAHHARQVEIYAPQIAALSVVLACFDPVIDRERALPLRLVGVFVGAWAIWGFAELRLLLAPILAVAWLNALRRRRRFAPWAPLVVLWGSLPLVLLPLASARGPEVDWGDPQTLTRLVDHVLARSIRVAYADEMLPRSVAMWMVHAGGALRRFVEDLGAAAPAVVGIAMVAAWVGPLRLPERRAIATLTWLLLGSLVYSVGINPMGGPDRQTGLVLDVVAIWIVSLVAGQGFAAWPRLGWAVLPLAWTVLVVPSAWVSLPDAAVTRSWAPHAWSRAALDQLPPRTLLLPQSDDLAAGVLWARTVEGARPDVIVAVGQHLHRPAPDRMREDEARIWDAVATRATESARVAAAIAAAGGPVALENAGAGVYVQVDFRVGAGRLPLSVAPSGGPRVDSAAAIASEIDRWLPELELVDDRRRLAVAIAEWARGYVRQGGDVREAALALEDTLARLDADHGSAMVTLGGLHDRMGDRAAAIAWTRRSLELEPDRPAALLNLALYLSREPAGWGEAIALCQRAIELRPWRRDGWLRLADVLAAQGQHDAAAAARGEAERGDRR